MGTISTAQFKKGIYIIFHDEPHMVVDIHFVSPGKGSAFTGPNSSLYIPVGWWNIPINREKRLKK